MTSNTSSAALRPPQFTHCLLFFLHSKSKLALWHFTCLSWPSFWITHLVSMVASMTFHKLIPSSHRHLRPWLPVTTARTRTEARVILEPLNRVPTTLWPRPPRLLWRRLPRLLCRCRLMRTRPRSCCCVFCTCSRTWSQVRKTRAKILVLPTKVSNVLPSSDAQMPYRLSVSFNSFASLSGVILDWWRQILTGVVKRPHWHFTVLSYIQDQHMSKFAAVIDVFDLLEWVKHFFQRCVWRLNSRSCLSVFCVCFSCLLWCSCFCVLCLCSCLVFVIFLSCIVPGPCIHITCVRACAALYDMHPCVVIAICSGVTLVPYGYLNCLDIHVVVFPVGCRWNISNTKEKIKLRLTGRWSRSVRDLEDVWCKSFLFVHFDCLRSECSKLDVGNTESQLHCYNSMLRLKTIK